MDLDAYYLSEFAEHEKNRQGGKGLYAPKQKNQEPSDVPE